MALGPAGLRGRRHMTHACLRQVRAGARQQYRQALALHAARALAAAKMAAVT